MEDTHTKDRLFSRGYDITMGLLLGSLAVAAGCDSAEQASVEFDSIEERSDTLYLVGSKYPNGRAQVCLNDVITGHPGQVMPHDPDFWPSANQTRRWVEDSWNRYSDMNFYGWNLCGGITTNKVVLTLYRSNGGSANSQEINIGVNQTPSGRWQQVTLHEFGHALGFAHEWDRPDFSDGLCGKNGGSVYGGDTLGTPANDSQSIMLSTSYCNTNTSLSTGDIAGVRKAYGKSQTRVDFDGDGKTDVSVWRPSTGQWYAIHSSSGAGQPPVLWGQSGDVPVAGDYDGNGLTNRAIFRASTNTWHIEGVGAITWGGVGDKAVPGDYDGDAKTDIAIWRPSTGQWWIVNSSSGAQPPFVWGQNGDIPVPADYNGDDKTDIAVFRPSNHKWYIVGVGEVTLGNVGDVPVPGDYDGDRKIDVAVWRPSTGHWHIVYSSSGPGVPFHWGQNGDIPVLGDYNGDGIDDPAVFRPNQHKFYITGISPSAEVTWGAPGDVPPTTISYGR